MEKHLKLFEGRVQDKKASLVLPGSREAFDTFMNLNLFILGVKKVSRFLSRFLAPTHTLTYSSNLRI